MNLLHKAGVWGIDADTDTDISVNGPIHDIATTGRTIPYTQMQVWDAIGGGHLRWKATDVLNDWDLSAARDQFSLLLARLSGSETGNVSSPTSPLEGDVVPLGYMVEHNTVQQALHARLEALAKSNERLDFLCPASVSKVNLAVSSTSSSASAHSENNWPELLLSSPGKEEDDRTIRCRLLVAADGANSRVRQMCHMTT